MIEFIKSMLSKWRLRGVRFERIANPIEGGPTGYVKTPNKLSAAHVAEIKRALVQYDRRCD